MHIMWRNSSFSFFMFVFVCLFFLHFVLSFVCFVFFSSFAFCTLFGCFCIFFILLHFVLSFVFLFRLMDYKPPDSWGPHIQVEMGLVSRLPSWLGNLVAWSHSFLIFGQKWPLFVFFSQQTNSGSCDGHAANCNFKKVVNQMMVIGCQEKKP